MLGQASRNLVTGDILASAGNGYGTDNGGNVTLIANSAQVQTINTQSQNGRGGNIDVTVQQTFQAVNTLPDGSSLNAAGNTQGGSIRITHGGRFLGVPFTVGDASINGTAGAIATQQSNASNVITATPPQAFPESYTQGNIQIIATVPPPVPPPLPTPNLTPAPITPSLSPTSTLLPAPAPIPASNPSQRVSVSIPELQTPNVDFPPFQSRDGGYASVDDRGYQILLNLRAAPRSFQKVSLSDVLSGRISAELMRDRLVLIGSTAVGDGDVFFTAYSGGITSHSQATYGVELHANLTSQIISAVIDSRPPYLRPLPEWVEIVISIVLVGFSILPYRLHISEAHKLAAILGLGIAMSSFSYWALWAGGWWLPLIPALLSLAGTTLCIHAYRTRQFQASATQDELTKLANRRTFNEALQQEWRLACRSHRPLSLIICDVDYFKLYNDTYGHPQGDECLRQVAAALKIVARRSTDVVARYGGEEFVMLLPYTDAQAALKLAETARQRIKDLRLEHKASKVSEWVSLSLGITTWLPDSEQRPDVLIKTADLGLYEAKQQGRDQVVFKLPDKGSG